CAHMTNTIRHFTA
ncbi:molybdopterin oxidoreductase family protein, partial [Vibrio parahaemolyticus EKP-008]